VLIDADGSIKIYFTLTGVSYTLNITDIDTANSQLFDDCTYMRDSLGVVTFENFTPDPPYLVDATRNSIKLGWRLPQPPGIAQHVEVQYTTKLASSNGVMGNKLAYGGDTLLSPTSTQYSSLVSKTYGFPDFLQYTFDRCTLLLLNCLTSIDETNFQIIIFRGILLIFIV
jgi:hypothetical protein